MTRHFSVATIYYRDCIYIIVVATFAIAVAITRAMVISNTLNHHNSHSSYLLSLKSLSSICSNNVSFSGVLRLSPKASRLVK
jgi:hypothetical protein